MKKIVIFTLSLCVLCMCFINETNANELKIIYKKGEEGKKRIALTFDDGPHPRYTKEILEILAQYNIKATFFVIGVNVENYPDSLRLIAESGCEIGNHTYSHKNLKNENELRGDIKKCEDMIYSVCGQKPTVFRPPRGILSYETVCIAGEFGYDIILWSIDTLDWSLNPSEAISKEVTKNIRDGDIILMHDYVSGGNTTIDALRLFIPRLLSEGYEFVTISELI